jgi:hypothetical protein
MKKNKTLLTEDTRIMMGDIPVGDYRNYFLHILGKEFLNNLNGMDFQSWLNTQVGKTLKKAVGDYLNPTGNKKMEELLEEERFYFVLKENKIFIIEFTKQMNLIDYDFGGSIGDGFCWGHNMIIYSQKKKVIARIFIRDKGVRMWGGNEHKWNNCIVLRLFFTNIDKHMKYIETAPSHIKVPFLNDQGLCTHCSEKCHNRKTYTINGQKKEKCGYVFSFTDPKIEHLKDYMDILKEFYCKKLVKDK